MSALVITEVLDTLAFLLLGTRGRLGAWASDRVVNVWLRPSEIDVDLTEELRW